MRRAALAILASLGLTLGSVIACSSFGEDPSDVTDGGVEGGPAADDVLASDAATTDASVVPADCKAIHLAEPAKPDGFYAIGPPGADPGTTVYCDMTTHGGGWTLIARSASGASDTTPFGWSSTYGHPDDTLGPYSANAVALRLDFRELLLGARGDARMWATPIYSTPADQGFVTKCADAGCRTAIVSVSDGGCAAPHQLDYDGYTARTDGFFFRNRADADSVVYGLKPSRWVTSFQNLCSEDANLDGKQGMIFVR